MAAYNITTSSGGSITINDGAINNNYSIPIIGQNVNAYGDDIATAFIRGLENFAADSAPNANTNIPGTNLLIGQLWYDTANVQLKVWTGSSWAPLLTSASGASFAGDIVPGADSLYDVGTTGLRWAEGWFDDVAFGGTMTAEGTSTVTVSGTLTADGGSTVNLSGTNTINGATMTAKVTLDAASGGNASINIPSGTTTSTTDGDMWYDGSNLRIVVGTTQKTIPTTDGISVGVVTFNGRSGTVLPFATDYADGAYNFYPRRDAGSTATIASTSSWTFSNTPSFANASGAFTVTSTNLVTNLNADRLDGQHGSYYAVDADVVKITGAQTVQGVKTFTDTTVFDNSAGYGITIAGSTNTTANVSRLSFTDSVGTESVRIGPAGADTTRYQNFLSTNVDFSGNNNNIKMRLADQTTLYAGNGSDEAAQTQTLGGAGATSQLLVWNSSASRNVGFNETPTITVAVNTSLDYTHIGSFLTRTGTGSVRIDVDDNVTTIPVGGSCMVHNDNATGTMTIAQGTGSVILEWIDGSGGAPLTGTRTLAYNGVATIRKKASDTTDVYQIWGVGLS